MRERWSRWLAALTGALVLLLSASVAWLQNRERPLDGAPRPEPAPGQVAAPADEALLARGRALFDSQGCVRCHSVAGHGSPRSPLDGVGAELDAGELWQWMVGDDAVADGLSTRARAAKQAYRTLPEPDREALVAWLQALR